MLRSQAELVEKVFFVSFVITAFLITYNIFQNLHLKFYNLIKKEKELIYFLKVKESIELVNKTNCSLTIAFPEKILFYKNTMELTETFNLGNVIVIDSGFKDKITIKKEKNKIIII